VISLPNQLQRELERFVMRHINKHRSFPGVVTAYAPTTTPPFATVRLIGDHGSVRAMFATGLALVVTDHVVVMIEGTSHFIVAKIAKKGSL